MEPTQATGILGLLQEIERQLGVLANRLTQTFYAPPNKTIVQLCHQDDDYYRMLTQLKSRLIVYFELQPDDLMKELACPIESGLWKIPAFCEPSWFIDPDVLKETFKSLNHLRETRRGKVNPRAQPTSSPPWHDPQILEWASNVQSSLILIQGTYNTLENIEQSAIELIEYLETKEQHVVWVLNQSTSGDNVSPWKAETVLRQIAIQILRRSSPLNLRTFVSVVEQFKGALTTADWLICITTALGEIPILYVIIDTGVFGANTEDATSLSDGFGNLFEEIRAQPRGSVLKVVLMGAHPFAEVLSKIPIIRIIPDNPSAANRRSLGRKPPHCGSGKGGIQLDLLQSISSVQHEDFAISPALQFPKSSSMHRRTASSTGTCIDKSSKDWFHEMNAFEICVDASRKDPDEAHPRVKIAVLDTGLDLSHPDIWKEYQNGRIKCYDFVENSASMKDLDGHGTHCTSVVMKFAPNAEVYVGRVFGKFVAEEHSPEVLIQAVRHAANVWNVDIISLSLGFTEDDENLRGEVRRACANDILVFSAAANNTINEVIPIRFPARMREVICVFSSDSHGRPSDFNPPPRYNLANFTFPGEQIEGAWPRTVSTEGCFERQGALYKYQDGTSCATPIAAAVAAGILEFASQEREHEIRRVKMLKHYIGMTDLFLHRMVGQHKLEEKAYHYVKPWMLITNKRRKDEIPLAISDTLDQVDC